MSVENRACIQVLNQCLMLFWYLMGALYLLFPNEILTTSLGKALLMGISFFWVIRLFVIQPVYVGFDSKESKIQVVIFIVGLALSLIPLLG